MRGWLVASVKHVLKSERSEPQCMWRSTCFAWMDLNHIINSCRKKMIDIQLFRERLSEKMCMRQSQKVIWDIINTPFLTLQLSNLRLLLSFNSSQTYVHGLSCHSFKLLWRIVYSKPPTIPFGIVACTFSDNLSRNSCMLCQELCEISLTVIMVNCHEVTCWIFNRWISC